MEQARLHPLLQNLQVCDKDDLEELVALDALWHVACYVVTDEGRLIVQSRKAIWASVFGLSQDQRPNVQSFGGCNFPNSLVRMTNSLRLELMDECGLVLTPENLVRSSPLILYPGEPQSVLLQVFLVREAAVPIDSLWSAEQARKSLGTATVPEDAGMWAIVPPEIRKMGACVKMIDFDSAKDAGRWRRCDLESLVSLDPLIARLRSEAFESSDVVLMAAKPGTPENVWRRLQALKRLVNSASFDAFRALTMQPWAPLLWSEAKRVFSAKPAVVAAHITEPK